MKKVKLIIMAAAIFLSVGGAFATGYHFDCRFNPQFYSTAGGYMPAGVFGVDYYCQDGIGTCTYIQVGSNYQACQTGLYTRIPQ
ncbi:MAG: DUF6520 family protein [Bacteroidota bacterium]|nr:DUF6520 family protein [Bacteroidota bacterium]